MVQSSFYADGGVVDEGVVESNDSTAPTGTTAAPSSMYPNGTIYDHLVEGDTLRSDIEADRVAAEAARVAAAASAADAAATVGSIQRTYASVAEAAASNVNPTSSTVRLTGYYTAGDGGGALYKRVGTLPAGWLGFQSGDGAWWQIAEPLINVKMAGAKGDWNGTTGTDDASAFQAAIDCVYTAGGGTVFVPNVLKAYRLGSQIHVKSGVTLSGVGVLQHRNNFVSTLDPYYGGACLAITWGAGDAGTMDTSTSCAVRMNTSTGVVGLNFIYPGQVDIAASAPVVFPPTISGHTGSMPSGRVKNCWFVNSYKAIDFSIGHPPVAIESVWGQIIKTFIRIGGNGGGDSLIDVNASGVFYMISHAAASFSNMTGLMAWVQANGVAFELAYNDAIRFTDCFIGNCQSGLVFGAVETGGGSNRTYGSWTGGGIEAVTFPFFVYPGAGGGLSSNGFRVINAGIAAVGLFNAPRSVVLVMDQATTGYSDESEYRAKIFFDGCEFWGAGNWSTDTGVLEGVVDATGGDVEFNGCTFKAFQYYIARAYSGTPVIKFNGCTFGDYPTFGAGSSHFEARAGAAGKILYSGCEFRGGPPRINYGSGATTFITGFSLSEEGLNNIIVNGGMAVDQEHAGAAVAAFTDNYIVDGWKAQKSGAMVCTAQQVTDAPPGLTNSLKITVTTAAASLGASDYVIATSHIEGLRTSRLAFGSSSASPVVLGFWTKMNRTGAYSGSIRNGAAANRSYLFSFTQNVANVWEYKTVSIPGDVTGTWATTSSAGMTISFAMAAGSSLVSAANAWSASNRVGVTGTTNGVAATSDTFQITGVVLLPGIIVPSAKRAVTLLPQFTEELEMCKRYYWKSFPYSTAVASNAGAAGAIAYVAQLGGASYAAVPVNFPCTMRATPTVTSYNPSAAGTNWYNSNLAANSGPFAAAAIGSDRFLAINNPQVAGDGVFHTLLIQLTADARL